MNARTRERSAAVAYKAPGVHEWCVQCGRAHTHAGRYVGDSPEDVLGLRGSASTLAYAWCAREGAYHYTSRRRGELNQVAPGRWTQRIAQPKRDVHTVRKYMLDDGTLLRAADVFVAQYDAQRSRLGVCTGNFAHAHASI